MPDATAVLNYLTPRQREAMKARLADPAGGVVPQRLVAERLKIKQSAVSKRLNNGVKRLRSLGHNVTALLARLDMNTPAER